jgi:hypothetical protein
MSDIEVGQVWRHKKRLSVYEIVAHSALIQCSTFPDVEAAVGEVLWVAYRGMGSGMMYFRPKAEFLDGRFELVE